LTLDTVDPAAIAAFLTRLGAEGIDALSYQSRARKLIASEFDQVKLRRRLIEACFPCAS
jgi:hypothetical protein